MHTVALTLEEKGVCVCVYVSCHGAACPAHSHTTLMGTACTSVLEQEEAHSTGGLSCIQTHPNLFSRLPITVSASSHSLHTFLPKALSHLSSSPLSFFVLLVLSLNHSIRFRFPVYSSSNPVSPPPPFSYLHCHSQLLTLS